jgi:dimeric dUTPase (all-alpha-NTP-PPase superfamily)
MSKLDTLFDQQKKLQEFFNIDFYQMSNITRKQYIKDNILDSIEELNSINKKVDKKKTHIVKESSKQNINDLFHFIINICIALEISPEELYEMYNKRNEYIYKNSDKYKKRKRR